MDPSFGGFANATLEEYVVPVNADIWRIDVGLIDRPDFHLNPVGVKGLGEVVMVGVAAAVANAVFHATDRRVRHLPIRLEYVLRPARRSPAGFRPRPAPGPCARPSRSRSGRRAAGRASATGGRRPARPRPTGTGTPAPGRG